MIKRKQKKFLKYYEPIHDRFERFCRALVYGEMEGSDLMNETLLVAFEKFDKVNSEESFFSFLCEAEFIPKSILVQTTFLLLRLLSQARNCRIQISRS